MLESSMLSGIDFDYATLIFQFISFTSMIDVFAYIPSFQDIYHIINYHPDGHNDEALKVLSCSAAERQGNQ